IAPSDIQISRSGSNLVLSLKGSTDKVTLNGYFTNDGASGYAVDEIRFADGTVWNVEQVKVLALQGTEGNDTLTGYAIDDAISGGLGNDTLSGQAGNDVLSGEAGNDTLNGEDGNDALLGGDGTVYLYGDNGDDGLDGGTGNDILSGEAGSDIYRFSRGWGQDTIVNHDATTGKVDAIEFAADIASS